MAGALGSSFQSILLPVREVDALVDAFRIEGDWSRKLGVPAHLTLAGPWPLTQDLLRKSLSVLACAARGTSYRLDSVDMLGGTICLVPSDDRPLSELRTRMLNAIGEPDAVTSTWRFHLTICRNESADQILAVREALAPAMPLNCAVHDLCISQLIEPRRVIMESL